MVWRAAAKQALTLALKVGGWEYGMAEAATKGRWSRILAFW